MSPEIVDLIIKGLTSLPALVAAGVNIYDRVEQLKTLTQGSADGTISAADIAKIRAQFDADLDDFDTPMK